MSSGVLELEKDALRWSDVWRASSTLQLSAHSDTFYAYLHETPAGWHLPFRHLRERIFFWFVLAFWVHRKTGYTIGNGLALVSLDSGRAKRLSDKIWGVFLGIAEKMLCAPSKEQIRRAQEYKILKGCLLRESFGEDGKDSMILLDSLATHPSVRRQGYCGALVDYVSRQADNERRSTYLWSSNPTNTEFYNNHGYHEVAVAFLGDSNPVWKKPPVRCPLFCRKYNSDTNT
ncbi:hypothetical protein SCHPADRAFT_284477 [Schizopora paradoxa]|uniref:N-acetyltransferase domain-containing protein n=1 Tax=Schizopora paradoxa TaxID=27342 RepID=A0A0H2SDK0_9AGAM|nr:hypothetical protein SCHPADRAFT_284477 [Schizopora paradoxa]